MAITKLSSKGQVIIPKSLRIAHRWEPGLELMVIEMEDGIFLRPKTPFAETTLDEVAGIFNDTGKVKTDAEIEQAMKRAVREAWLDRR